MSRDEQAKTTSKDADFLRERVTELERQVADLRTGFEMQASGGERALLEAVQEARARLEQVEKENQEFANMYVEIQEQNEALTNLYVASQRLHATFDLEEVKQIITEILVEMVGAKEFGLLLLDRSKRKLRVLTGEGIRERLPKDSLPLDEGIIGDVAATGESFYFEPKSETEVAAQLPLGDAADEAQRYHRGSRCHLQATQSQEGVFAHRSSNSRARCRTCGERARIRKVAQLHGPQAQDHRRFHATHEIAVVEPKEKQCPTRISWSSTIPLRRGC